MKLTTKKLESLILEMIEDGYSKEQEEKILALIKKTRHELIELQIIQGFYPTIINGVYSYDDTEDAIRDMTAGPIGKKAVKKHYGAVQKIAEILELVNYRLVLLEDLEIQGNLAFIAKGMIYGGLSGPVTGVGHKIKLEELSNMVNSGITFLEDVAAAAPDLLGEGNLGLEAMRGIVDSFHYNYSNLKDYLDRAKWN